MIIRAATVDDAVGIGHVHVASWQETYRDQMPENHLAALRPEQRAANWRRYLERSDHDRAALFVAEEGGEIAGFVGVGPSRDEDLRDFGEVRAIYVHPNRVGLGFGRELMIAGLDAMRSAHFSDAFLWVLEGNQRAQRFYEGGGWMPDGSTKHDESLGFGIDEVRYRIDLAR